MKIPGRSTEGAFNATGSGRESHGDMADLDKWLKDTMRPFDLDDTPFLQMPDIPVFNFHATGSGREPHGVPIFEKAGLDKWLKDTMRPFDGMPFIQMPDIPVDNFHPARPSGKRPPIEKTLPSFDDLPPMKAVFDNWPPMTSIDDWRHVDYRNRIEPDFKTFDFKASVPEPPPPRHSPGFNIARALGGAVAGLAVLMILAGCIICIRGKSTRPRRGRVTGADAVQQSRVRISTNQPSIPNYPRRPAEQGGTGQPLNNDLPPSYECALSSIQKYVSDEPPPYTYFNEAEPEVHTRRQNALIENEFKSDAVAMTTTSNDSEAVNPEMTTELVFANGRIVERLSLDLSSNNKETRIASDNNETGIASDNNVEQQSTRHANVKDRVVYVDETDNVKVNTQ